VNFESVKAAEKFSHPPPRYNPSSLLREMEANEIGTKATRAEIVETLVRRGYIKGERIEVTHLGIRMVDVLEKYCPKVLDVTFTRELEEMMMKIELGKEEKQRVINQAIDGLRPAMDELKAHEQEVGEAFSFSIEKARIRGRVLAVSCPKCGRTLQVIKSRKTGKRFIGCRGKWEGTCEFALPLPQFGTLDLLDKRCARCGFQLIGVTTKGRRPFVTCAVCYRREVSGKG